MRLPGLLAVALALVCATPAVLGASEGTMTTQDAVNRALVLLLVAWGADLLLRPVALRLIHGPTGAPPRLDTGPEVPAQDGPTVPEVA